MQLGVEKVELDELFRRADFITLHTPLTEKTKNIIDAGAIAKMKDGVRIINCARGGLVDEDALRAALDSGQVAGAAFDATPARVIAAHAVSGRRRFVRLRLARPAPTTPQAAPHPRFMRFSFAHQPHPKARMP